MESKQSRDEREKIIKRIRHLAGMAGSANENEAAIFAERVQAELLRYNLTMADIHEKQHDSEEIIMDDEVLTVPFPEWRNLANATAKLYLCSYFWSEHEVSAKSINYRHHFVGTVGNVMVAKFMFTYLREAVQRLAQQGANKLPKKRQSPYRVDFRRACVKRLGQRIYERIEEAKDKGVTLLLGHQPGDVLPDMNKPKPMKSPPPGDGGIEFSIEEVEQKIQLPALRSLYESQEQAQKEFIEKNVGGLEERKAREQKTLDEQAREDGTKAGDQISLDRQIEQDKTKRIAQQ